MTSVCTHILSFQYVAIRFKTPSLCCSPAPPPPYIVCNEGISENSKYEPLSFRQ